MLPVPCFDAAGNALDPLEIDETLFGEQVLYRTLHQVVKQYRANLRVGTHATRTRGQVRGTGRKPWRQKGTGRARAGSFQSPIWRGGGVTFGPHPRNYRREIPKRMRQAALDSALLAKFRDGEVLVVEGLVLDAPRTKTVATMLANAGIYRAHKGGAPGKGRHTFSTLIVADDRVVASEREGEQDDEQSNASQNLYRSARNIERVDVTELRGLNAYDVVRKQRLLFVRTAFDALVARVAARPASKRARDAS